jgi:malic enzyme
MSAEVKNAILCDSKGIIYEGRKENMNPVKEEMANEDNIIPNAFDPRAVEAESEAVAQAAIESGVARI